jgi:phage baseplate assembly protein W
MTVSVSDITSIDWSPRLGAIGEIVEGHDDIHQCIRIILITRKGSVPHRPEFGSDWWRYIDYPINQAVPPIVREAIDAITTWERRVSVVSISVAIDASTVSFTIVWRLRDAEATHSATVEVSL